MDTQLIIEEPVECAVAPSPVESANPPTTVATPSPAKIEPPVMTPDKAQTTQSCEVMHFKAMHKFVSRSLCVDRCPWPK